MKNIDTQKYKILTFAVKSSELTQDMADKAMQLLPLERQDKVKAKFNIKDKNNTIAAGLLLNYAVSQYYMCDKENIIEKQDIDIAYVTIDKLIKNYNNKYDYKVKTKVNGKPYFVEHEEIYFNISHSGEYAVCVIGNTENGIDIEGKRKNVLKIAKRFFEKNEYEWLSNEMLSEDDKITRFLQLWTLKESYSKVTGEGIAYGIKEAIFTTKNNTLIFADEEKRKKYNVYQVIKDEYVITVMCNKLKK